MPTPSLLQLLGFQGFKGPGRGTELVAEYAKEAAANFLNNNVPLNETIQKIAQAEGLSPDAVEMTCWEANKQVHAVKFASGQDKYVEFPLANAKEVLGSLQSDSPKTTGEASEGSFTGTVKAASACSYDDDYATSPEGRITDFELCKSAGHDGKDYPQRNLAYHQLEKCAMQLRDLEADIALSVMKIKDIEVEFMKEARAGFLELPFAERPEAFRDVAMMAKTASPKYQKNILTKLATILIRQGLMEKSGFLDDLISDDVARKCQVIDGNHRLYKLINTLHDECTRHEALKDRWNVVQTAQHNIESKMRLM